MTIEDQFSRLEKFITTDRNLAASLISCIAIFLIFINLTTIHSPILGAASSLTFIVINTIFVGNAFFREERGFLRLSLGTLLLIAFLGLVSWAIMIIHNLDEIRSTVALLIVATLSSAANKLARSRWSR